jgi:hypothetical protein
LLNRASRFFPILQELKPILAKGGSVLEVGSGSLGLGEYWNGPFVGCDVTFSSPPVKNMRAVCCSGDVLPFKDGSFDAVVASDVMEHVAPPVRTRVVSEAIRVARNLAIFGFPCGRKAFNLDEQLFRDYRRQNAVPPRWLEEHMVHAFPDENLIQEPPQGWQMIVVPNERLDFHYWMMRREMSLPWDRSFRLALHFFPGIVERLLRHANREPSYRKIFVLSRVSQEEYV